MTYDVASETGRPSDAARTKLRASSLSALAWGGKLNEVLKGGRDMLMTEVINI